MSGSHEVHESITWDLITVVCRTVTVVYDVEWTQGEPSTWWWWWWRHDDVTVLLSMHRALCS